jgi:hypothetical protein
VEDANEHLMRLSNRARPKDQAVIRAIYRAWQTTKAGRRRSHSEMERLYIRLAQDLRRQLLEQLAAPLVGPPDAAGA